MAIGFHFDDVEEAYFNSKYYGSDAIPPIGAPVHDDDKEGTLDDFPPIGAPCHD